MGGGRGKNNSNRNSNQHQKTRPKSPPSSENQQQLDEKDNMIAKQKETINELVQRIKKLERKVSDMEGTMSVVKRVNDELQIQVQDNAQYS